MEREGFIEVATISATPRARHEKRPGHTHWQTSQSTKARTSQTTMTINHFHHRDLSRQFSLVQILIAYRLQSL